LLFDAALATKGLSAYANVVNPGAISVVDDPVVFGRKVLKLTVPDGSTGGLTGDNRAQVETAQQFAPGQDIYIGFSILFPADFPDLPAWFSDSDPSWLTLAEVYGPPFAGSSPYSVAMNGPHAGNPAQHGSTLQFGPWTDPAGNVQRGIWYDFVVHEKLSGDASNSVAELWINRGQGWVKQSVPQRPTLSSANNGGLNYHKLALYYRHNQWPTVTAYEGEHRIGTTFGDVTPHSYG
jgi:hypothetical protein